MKCCNGRSYLNDQVSRRAKSCTKMAPAFDLKQITQELQISRECALLGQYETSLLYYESIVQSLFLYSKTLPEGTEKNKTLDIRDDIKNEFQVVKEISMELASFKERKSSRLSMNRSPSPASSRESHKYDKDVWPAPDPLPGRPIRKKQTPGTNPAHHRGTKNSPFMGKKIKCFS